MRAILGMHSRVDRWHALLTPAVAGMAGLLLAACQSDGPTGVAGDGGSTAIVAFPLAAGAATAAATSTNRLIRTLPTVQLRSGTQARLSAADTHTNSPLDLTYLGGPLVTHSTSRNVYVNCASGPAICWGTGDLSPATFLRDLNGSSMIQIADQYLAEDAAGKFGVAELKTTAPFAGHTATINDILGIVFSASTFTHASGYQNIFHVFLPKGTDMCITAGDCYSPDSAQNFAFCAFHASVDFGPNQHVLFSVEPYQAVAGCRRPQQTRVIDATASTLSHEFFETITDPFGTSWFNTLTGNEIGDLCAGFQNTEPMSRHSYVIQEEYSNTVHACTDGAF
jgi:hypothetical protein